jgi:DNA-binding beta-propeller fold protein YncE
MRVARGELASLFIAGLVLLLTTAGALAATGDLTQPAGTAGCVSENGTGSCADGNALFGPGAVAVSPDGKSVYVASQSADAVARLKRNKTTGAIVEPSGTGGCISAGGVNGCAAGHGFSGMLAVAVSPDGKTVYAASQGADTVVRLNRRSAAGGINQPAGTAGCISETGRGRASTATASRARSRSW